MELIPSADAEGVMQFAQYLLWLESVLGTSLSIPLPTGNRLDLRWARQVCDVLSNGSMLLSLVIKLNAARAPGDTTTTHMPIDPTVARCASQNPRGGADTAQTLACLKALQAELIKIANNAPTHQPPIPLSTLATKVFSGNYQAIAYCLHLLFVTFVVADRVLRSSKMLAWYENLSSAYLAPRLLPMDTSLSILSVGSIASVFADGTAWFMALHNLRSARGLYSFYSHDNERALSLGDAFFRPVNQAARSHNITLCSEVMREDGIHNYFDLKRLVIGTDALAESAGSTKHALFTFMQTFHLYSHVSTANKELFESPSARKISNQMRVQQILSINEADPVDNPATDLAAMGIYRPDKLGQWRASASPKPNEISEVRSASEPEPNQCSPIATKAVVPSPPILSPPMRPIIMSNSYSPSPSEESLTPVPIEPAHNVAIIASSKAYNTSVGGARTSFRTPTSNAVSARKPLVINLSTDPDNNGRSDETSDLIMTPIPSAVADLSDGNRTTGPWSQGMQTGNSVAVADNQPKGGSAQLIISDPTDGKLRLHDCVGVKLVLNTDGYLTWEMPIYSRFTSASEFVLNRSEDNSAITVAETRTISALGNVSQLAVERLIAASPSDALFRSYTTGFSRQVTARLSDPRPLSKRIWEPTNKQQAPQQQHNSNHIRPSYSPIMGGAGGTFKIPLRAVATCSYSAKSSAQTYLNMTLASGTADTAILDSTFLPLPYSRSLARDGLVALTFIYSECPCLAQVKESVLAANGAANLYQ